MKLFSKILKILSIIAAVITGILAALLIYDWIKLSKTPVAYLIEFWEAIDFYAKYLMWSTGIGLLVSGANFIINARDRFGVEQKEFARNVFAIFLLAFPLSAVLLALPIDINF